MKKTTSSFLKLVFFCLYFMFSFHIGFSQCSDEFLLGTRNSNGNGYNWGNAFRASCSGRIEYVQLYACNSGTVAAGTLKIYNGAGVTGTPVYTQSYPAFSVTADGPLRVDLTGDFEVVSGNQYTFVLYVSGVNIYYYPSFSIYPGGGSWQNGAGSYKHNFKVGILGILANETFDVVESAIFPNPTNGNFSIQLDQSKDITVEVFDVLGKKVFSTAYQNQLVCDVNLDHASKGLYFVKINDGRKIESQKIFIQ
ncbi:MAG: T9SS type A sorting domain-containing protein [Flavobacterium sp.]|nr:T9SS type A sorting domain-containing protein [Flavobacterium sp.]